MPQTPVVSIVLPFRNAADTLPECLQSICAQTLPDWELLAVNDGSRDDSAQLLRNLSDPRIRILEPGNVGLVAALNLGVSASRASFIARMDADDVMHPERLEAQVQYLNQNPEIVLVGCQVELFSKNSIRTGYREYIRWQNECITPAQIVANLYVESPIAHPSVLFRKELFDRIGDYASGTFPEDYELWLRIAAAGYGMSKVPRRLLQWREQPQRLSRIDPRYSREAFDQLRARFLARDPRLLASTQFVIWGAGRKTRQRAQLLLDHGLHPACWIDIDPRKIGKIYNGIPVQSPDWLCRIPDSEPRTFVLIYVTNHGAREEISQTLERFGYKCGENYLAVG